MLTEIRRLLRANGPTSLAELALRLGSQPEAVRAMLEVWMAKGRVARLPVPGGCGSDCRACAVEQVEVYVWADDRDAVGTPLQDCRQR